MMMRASEPPIKLRLSGESANASFRMIHPQLAAAITGDRNNWSVAYAEISTLLRYRENHQLATEIGTMI